MNRIYRNKQIRMMMKIILIILCICLLKTVYDKGKEWMIPQPEGIYVSVGDVMILSKALQEDVLSSEIYQKLESRYLADKNAKLTYQEYLGMVEWMGTKETPLFDSAYRPEHFLLQADWEGAFEEMCRFYDSQGEISRMTVAIAGIEDMVSDSQGDSLGDKQLLTGEGMIYFFESEDFRKYHYQVVEAFCKGRALLTVAKVVDSRSVLSNVFLLGEQDTNLLYFFRDYEIKTGMATKPAAGEEVQEQLADLHFEGGVLTEIALKKEKISGKLIALTEKEITVEGHGTFPLTEQMQIYRLYDSLKTCHLKELALGYDFTDFVLEEGKICGALVTEKEAMEYIRVAIRTKDFGGLVHGEISLTADVDYTVIYGRYDDRKNKAYRAGEEFRLTPDSEYLQDGSVVVKPEAGTGKVSLLSLNRSQGIPSYRGMVEIKGKDDGLTVVNEVLLEEYLYSVVPSEMPSSYPLEALKAQAVCARTYAYRYLLQPGLGDMGAHVDDSVSYQVYNNVAEHTHTTKAVKETAGQILYYQDVPADTYYYSTSCGYGTTVDVWKNQNREEVPYLQAAVIGSDSAGSPQDMMEEEEFSRFIEAVRESDYEKEEPWYRWMVAVKDMSGKTLEEHLEQRYGINPQLILTLVREEFVSQPVRKVGEIKDIYCEKRLPGGVMDEVVIVTTKNTFKVISENAIRYVLHDGVSEVVRQDGSKVISGELLPSAFMVIDLVKKNGLVTEYQLRGGGYGHGVGMSQNGARAMGLRGDSWEEILNCFYGACKVKEIYKERG